jgi:TPR repeat protein
MRPTVCCWLLSVLLVIGLTASVGAAPDLRRGVSAYEANRFRAALEDLLPLARANNPEAQFYLGVMAHDGLGRAPDRVESAEWFRQSAVLPQGAP